MKISTVLAAALSKSQKTAKSRQNDNTSVIGNTHQHSHDIHPIYLGRQSVTKMIEDLVAAGVVKTASSNGSTQHIVGDHIQTFDDELPPPPTYVPVVKFGVPRPRTQVELDSAPVIQHWHDEEAAHASTAMEAGPVTRPPLRRVKAIDNLRAKASGKVTMPDASFTKGGELPVGFTTRDERWGNHASKASGLLPGRTLRHSQGVHEVEVKVNGASKMTEAELYKRSVLRNAKVGGHVGNRVVLKESQGLTSSRAGGDIAVMVGDAATTDAKQISRKHSAGSSALVDDEGWLVITGDGKVEGFEESNFKSKKVGNRFKMGLRRFGAAVSLH